MATRRVIQELTLEQEETIKALFNHNNWDYKEIKRNTGQNIFYFPEISEIFCHRYCNQNSKLILIRDINLI